MHFKKNGGGAIETNWKTIASMATALAVIIGIITTAVNVGIGWGATKKEVQNVKEITIEIKSNIKYVAEKLDDHEKRLDKLEIKR